MSKTKSKKSDKRNRFKQFSGKQKAIIILLAIAFIIAIIYSVATIIYRTGKTKVVIRVAPNVAVITLNNTRVSNNTTIWVEPGEYAFKATTNSEHLNSYESQITVENTPVYLYATLSAVDDEGREYIQKHRQEYVVVEGLIGNLDNTEGEKIKKEYPILRHLPINNNFYSISYEYDQNNKPIINIKTTDEFIDTTVEKLKTFDDVELADYNIIFHNKSPFSDFTQVSSQDVENYIRSTYKLTRDYKINELKQSGDYFYTYVYKNNSEGDSCGKYRIILKKDANDEWSAISTPQPILTTYNTPGVDKEIIKLANSY